MSVLRQSRLPHRFLPNLTLKQRFVLIAILLLLPAIALRMFTTVYPFLQTGWFSLQNYNPAFPPQRFIALQNFERLFNDPVVRASVSFTLLFVGVSTVFQVIFGLAVAHLLNAPFKLRGVARMLSLIPWAIPMVVAALGFRWMFDDQFGMIPDLLQRFLGLDTKWLIDPRNAQIAVIVVNIWKSTPFVALVLLAGLQGISLDLYEAARVDGANAWQSLRFVTVPILMPIIVTTCMFMLVWQLAVFDLPFAMTGGGPGFSTTVLAQKIYLEMNALNYGYAAALSMVLVFIVVIIGVVGLTLFRRYEVNH
jgi:multiple sugar transport system permease protein